MWIVLYCIVIVVVDKDGFVNILDIVDLENDIYKMWLDFLVLFILI